MNTTKIDQKLVDKLEEISDPGELMAELFHMFEKRAAIGTSGQWTGVALIDMAIRAGISDLRVYTVDTLRLFPETYDLFRELEKRYNIKIEKVTPDFEAVSKMVRDHGEMIFFDSKAKQEHCCNIRKVDPNNKILDTLDVWITGLRADQSNANRYIGINGPGNNHSREWRATLRRRDNSRWNTHGINLNRSASCSTSYQAA